MQNPIIRESYLEAKQKAKELYKSIGRVWCPALNDYVSFDKAGFRHLMQKGRVPRIKSEQRRRFALLVHVKDILNTEPFVSVEERIVNDNCVRYWKFVGNRGGVVVKLVVRQVEGRQKHFFSVYGQKQKPAPLRADS
jgi:hypothetical protein